MTVEFNIESDIKKFTKDFTGLRKKEIPFATAMALNKTGRGLAKELGKRTNKYFEGGSVRFTQTGFEVPKWGRATKKDLATIVKPKPKQAKYLDYQIAGGRRTPSGVPEIQAVHENTTASILTKQGNITRGRYKSIKGNKDKYFLGVPKGFEEKSRGIWERYNSNQNIRMVAKYIKSGQYRPLFPFYKIGEQVFFGRGRGAFFKTFQKEMINILAKKGYR